MDSDSTISQGGRKTARQLVKDVAKANGYLGESVYARMDQETRREVQEALLIKDKMIGASVMLLARELYSKDVRFIFELLQNADDNKYRKARAAGSVPCVDFSLYRKQIVVDCNEDGFNEINLKAICSIGKSSKAGDYGYIGEKGIGFKSVFKVAWKVHIQSGDYSFAFIHRPGDSGMGMISPEWEDTSVVLQPGFRTRITLHLLQDSEAPARHESICQQLNDLECNMLLFLKNIRRIRVRIYDDDGESRMVSTTMSITMDDHRAVLRHYREENGSVEETRSYSHVTKLSVTGLPMSENRKYTKAERATGAYGNAEVILAFPLTEDSRPIIEAQQVFAFLPIRRLGFNFVIHTDFVTMANREDIVSSSARNLALLDAIADAFIRAIQEMYEHETLRYQWMRYLRNIENYPWDPYWQKLVERLSTRVAQVEILEPRRRGPPRPIHKLRRLSSSKTDANDNPLFEDLPGKREMYISTDYQPTDLAILQDFGLQWLSMQEFLERVKRDLAQPESRMKSRGTSQKWHQRAAKALNTSWRKFWSARMAETEALQLLPLVDGRWVSAHDAPVFFPTVDNGVPVPTDLGLRLLKSSACDNTERSKLFTNVGAQQATPAMVRKYILRRYSGDHASSIDLEMSYSHLLFLYHTHQDSDDSEFEIPNLKLFDTEGRFSEPLQTDYYFPSEERYSLWQLSRQGEDDWFKKNVSFIHSRYLESPPDQPDEVEHSWEGWLELLSVQTYPTLLRPDSSKSLLSKVCLHIAENLPSDFLGFLRHVWEYNEEDAIDNEKFIQRMKKIKVLCKGEDCWMLRMSGTYLPLPSLREKCLDLMGDDFFPFLHLDEPPPSDEDTGGWGFLRTHLGVGADDNLRFYVDMLYWIREASGLGELDCPSRILSVYARIQSRCLESRDREGDQDYVRHQVNDNGMLYIPRCGDDEDLWVSTSDCLLGAPRDLAHKIPILARYAEAFARPTVDLSLVTSFFRDTLDIRSCDWEDIIEEIKELKDDECSDFDRIRSQYERLNEYRREWVTTDTNTNHTRTSFEESSLILVQNQQGQYRWVKPSECLWSSATEIRDKISLNVYYDDDLEDFFITILGVPRLDVQMVYDELSRVNPDTTTVEQVKILICTLNALLDTDVPEKTPRRLLKKPIFPVRYPSGEVELESGDTEFAIVDRRQLEQSFRDKVKILDFTRDEVHKLKAFLKWTKLGSRCLSKVTKEISIVQSELTYRLSDPTYDVRKKAYALTRVAAHLQSPRICSSVQDFYNLIAEARTLETDGISAQLTMVQDETAFSVELERSEVHIQDNEAGLKIYVPHDKVSQEVCFGSVLPEQLVRWMVTDPVTQIQGQISQLAIKVVMSILGTRSTAAVDRILEKEGIVEIDNLEHMDDEHGAPIEERELRESGSIGSLSSSTAASSDTGVLTPTTTPHSAVVDEDWLDNDIQGRYSANYYPPRRYRRAQSSLSSPPSVNEVASALEEYRKLLGHVIRTGRITELPRRGSSDLSGYSGHGGPDINERVMFRSSLSSQFERDMKVGAAGELFVFELLSSLRPALVGFTHDNWQSTIRKYVDVHPEYSGMLPWTGRETSDITYDDRTGVLTNALVDKGYLSRPDKRRRRNLKYYIEVKSTFGSCDTPFFMSDNQYHKMSELTTDRSIYIIFRVFNMKSDSIGVRIYVDPDRMRREGQLTFSADKWIVTPGSVEGL